MNPYLPNGFEEDAPWKSLLIVKYNVGNLGWEVNLALLKAFEIWRAISACVDTFKQGICYFIGQSIGLIFWLDPWFDSSPLVVRFPSLSVCDYHLKSLVANSFRHHWRQSDVRIFFQSNLFLIPFSTS